MLCPDGERVVAQVDVDILFMEARQFRLKEVMISFIQNVGPKLCKVSAEVAKEVFLKVVEEIEQVSSSVFKRHQIKHTNPSKIASIFVK